MNPPQGQGQGQGQLRWVAVFCAAAVAAAVIGTLAATSRHDPRIRSVEQVAVACTELRVTTDTIELPAALDDTDAISVMATDAAEAYRAFRGTVERGADSDLADAVTADAGERIDVFDDLAEHPERFAEDPSIIYSTANPAGAAAGAPSCDLLAGPSWSAATGAARSDERAWFESLEQRCAATGIRTAAADDAAGATGPDAIGSYLDAVAAELDDLDRDVGSLGTVPNPWRHLVVQRWRGVVAQLAAAAEDGDRDGVRTANQQWRTLAASSGAPSCARGLIGGDTSVTAVAAIAELPARTPIHGVVDSTIVESEAFSTKTYIPLGTDPRFVGVDPTNTFGLGDLVGSIAGGLGSSTAAATPTSVSLGVPTATDPSRPASAANPWSVTAAVAGTDGICTRITFTGWPRPTGAVSTTEPLATGSGCAATP